MAMGTGVKRAIFAGPKSLQGTTLSAASSAFVPIPSARVSAIHGALCATACEVLHNMQHGKNRQCIHFDLVTETCDNMCKDARLTP